MIARCITFLKWQARDLIISRGKPLLSYARFVEYFFLKLINNQKNIRYLMDAHRFYPTPHLTKIFNKSKKLFLEKIDELVENIQEDQFDWVTMRSIILKKPITNGKVEKGVLLITFTESFAFFYKYVDCEQLLRYFYVILEPSWSGYCNPNILFWMRYEPHQIVVQSSEEKDYSFIISLKTNLIPVDFGASDWVDYRIFHPIQGVDKKFDAIYVCTYKPIKRHHVLFRAISKINDPSYKVALVCVNWGGKRSEIEHLIDHYRIRNNIVLYENCPPEQVNELLNMSKVNVLLSLKEGSNRSIFEGFFSNVPCIVLKNNVGVNKKYINPMTGKLILENKLKETLLYFRKNWDRYNPREWAIRNISPLITTKKLSSCLQKISRDNNEIWTADIVPKVNVPEVKYFFPADKQNFPDSGTIISLFSKKNTREVKNKQILQDCLERICYKSTHKRADDSEAGVEQV